MKTTIATTFLALAFFLTGCEGVLFYPTSQFYYDPKQYNLQPEDVWFMGENENKIHGWFFDSQTAETPKAQILFFHGNAQNLTAHYVALSWMPKHGYPYFIWDYQGYGQSEGAPTTENIFKDGVRAFEWMYQHNPNVPIIIFAQSVGSAGAMRVALEVKDRYPVKAVVIDSGFDSYNDIARFVMNKANLPSFLESFLPTDEWAPRERIHELSPIPMLIIHGDNDQVVDFSFGQRVYEFAGTAKEFWHIPGGTHIDAFRREGGKYRELFLGWLQNLR